MKEGLDKKRTPVNSKDFKKDRELWAHGWMDGERRVTHDYCYKDFVPPTQKEKP